MVIPKIKEPVLIRNTKVLKKKISYSLLQKQCSCAGSLINTTGSVMKSANSLVPKFSKDLDRVVINKSKYPPNTSALCHHQHGGVELTQDLLVSDHPS